MQRVEILLGDGFVDRPPPDLVVAVGLVDDELVVGRPTGVVAGADNQRPQVGQRALAPPYRVFIQGRCRQIPEDLVQVVQAVRLQAAGGAVLNAVEHVISPLC